MGSEEWTDSDGQNLKTTSLKMFNVNIIRRVQYDRFQWADYLVQMSEKRIAKMIFSRKFYFVLVKLSQGCVRHCMLKHIHGQRVEPDEIGIKAIDDDDNEDDYGDNEEEAEKQKQSAGNLLDLNGREISSSRLLNRFCKKNNGPKRMLPSSGIGEQWPRGSCFMI